MMIEQTEESIWRQIETEGERDERRYDPVK
jgi:hypothetical protein